MRYDFIIGIDPGVNTGFAIWQPSQKKFIEVKSAPIHYVMELIKRLVFTNKATLKVRFEDARQRKWFGKAGREQLQGAGSIKRDCTIWSDYLTSLGITFDAVAPKNNKTKLTAELFERITKHKGLTNEHSRDAAMLVFNLT